MVSHINCCIDKHFCMRSLRKALDVCLGFNLSHELMDM